jgi:uncharacterized protein YdiU (UPF0061 family)
MKNIFGFNLENTYVGLPETFYERVSPTPVRNPELIIYNKNLGNTLGLDSTKMTSTEGVAILSGNELLDDSIPIAQSYAGHQFGNFTMLGDGRAVLLGEQVTDSKRLDIQLKGAGRTSYSRGGDGRAPIGPMLREYIMSEALHALNIPTTRSLAVVRTGEQIQRETFLESAVLTRIASSHIRVGTFQYATVEGELSDLVALADYSIERHDPEAKRADNPYIAFYNHVIQRQAKLVADWQLVGFIHGVMNTDNMTISGETIDYGPCAFMDQYHEQTVFSSIDVTGRYMYKNQPGIAAWNLARLAEALLPLFGSSEEEAIAAAQEAVRGFQPIYEKYWLDGMRAKLGLLRQEDEDKKLVEELLNVMEHYHADYTNTFLALAYEDEEDLPMGQMEEFKNWKAKWQERVKIEKVSGVEIKKRMLANNPALIPRNQWVEEAIESAVQEEDYSVMKELISVLENPYAHTNEQREFAKKRFDTGRNYQTFCGT